MSSLLAAAFARLCVETLFELSSGYPEQAAAFARLCVETIHPVRCLVL